MKKLLRPRGFTMIEMLVVITVISLLVSLLLPAMNKSRQIVNATKCGAAQRGLAVGLESYATDCREYPTNYSRDSACSFNWGDECAGVWWGTSPTTVYDTPPSGGNSYSPLLQASPVTGSNMSAMERLFYNGNVDGYNLAGSTASQWQKSKAILCTGELRKGWVSTVYAGTTPYFWYNGPHSSGGNGINHLGVSHNGFLSGLTYMGRHQVQTAAGGWTNTGGEPFGLSYKYGLKNFKPSDVAFLSCPSFFDNSSAANILFYEPHGTQPAVNLGSNNGQDDSANGIYAYNRNYAFGDGHVRYIVADSRSTLPIQ